MSANEQSAGLRPYADVLLAPGVAARAARTASPAGPCAGLAALAAVVRRSSLATPEPVA